MSSSSTAPRCCHVKVNGTQCGSPAQRNERFCYFHRHCPPITIEYKHRVCNYSTAEVILPAFEDAYSIQLTLRQVTELIMCGRMDSDRAGLILYALQIASSNLKRMELEKPQPEQVVTDPEALNRESASETPLELTCHDQAASEVNASPQTNQDAGHEEHEEKGKKADGEDLPPGTIQACYRPGPPTRNRQSQPPKEQYVI
jgi:hypothetical protein